MRTGNAMRLCVPLLCLLGSLAACGDSAAPSASASAASSAPAPQPVKSAAPSASAPAPAASVAVGCVMKERAKGKGCPATKVAEAAFEKVKTDCKLDVAKDIMLTGPGDVSLGVVHDKICASCDCANDIQDYASMYSDCTDKTEKSNAQLAAALAKEVDKCGFKTTK
jgi:hypothetical protein